MNIDEFDYNLPPQLIAHQRSEESRVLVYDRSNQSMALSGFDDVIKMFNSNDCIVFNNTKVIPARLEASKKTGGKAEVFIESITSSFSAKVMVRSNGRVSNGLTLNLEGGGEVTLTKSTPPLFTANFNLPCTLIDYLFKFGRTPLPPYINPNSSDDVSKDYQTVFAQEPGAVAAPTAGLHFNDKHLQTLTCQKAFITLHVGLGTFYPVKSNRIEDHIMHHESYVINEVAANLINKTRARNGRIIGVGTTVLRTLESAFTNGLLRPTSGSTDIFIYPGFDIQSIDVLMTNFHLPKSTLFMLVCAMIGTKEAHRCYQFAIENQMRFYSYGDAMLIL